MKILTDAATMVMAVVGVMYLNKLKYTMLIDEDGVAKKVTTRRDKWFVNIAIIIYIGVVAYIGVSIR